MGILASVHPSEDLLPASPRAPHQAAPLLAPGSDPLVSRPSVPWAPRLGWCCLSGGEGARQRRAASASPSFLSPADPLGEEHYAGGAPGLPAFLVVVRARRCGRALEGAWVGARGETISPPAAHSVFWDLYCAAPDRREACEHSSEAKAFQDYVSPRPRGWDQGWAWAGACSLEGVPVGKWAGLWGLT